MEKPIYDEKYVEEAYEKLEADSPELHELIGWVEACKAWQKYFDWYIKEKCVKKEDLPDEKEIEDIIRNIELEYDENQTYLLGDYLDDEDIVKIVNAIAKRIRGKDEEKD